MAKVFLGVGHGGSDPGASANGFKEKDLNLSIALACRDELVRHGVNVKMSRQQDENDPLTEEIKECNAFGPISLSIFTIMLVEETGLRLIISILVVPVKFLLTMFFPRLPRLDRIVEALKLSLMIRAVIGLGLFAKSKHRLFIGVRFHRHFRCSNYRYRSRKKDDGHCCCQGYSKDSRYCL